MLTRLSLIGQKECESRNLVTTFIPALKYWLLGSSESSPMFIGLLPVRSVDHLADGDVREGPLRGPAQVARQLCPRRLPRCNRRRKGPVPPEQALSGEETEESHNLAEKVSNLFTRAQITRLRQI